MFQVVGFPGGDVPSFMGVGMSREGRSWPSARDIHMCNIYISIYMYSHIHARGRLKHGTTQRTPGKAWCSISLAEDSVVCDMWHAFSPYGEASLPSPGLVNMGLLYQKRE